MIQTFSSTIRRREMDAVLTCMVDEKIGPGELNSRLIQTVKEFTGCDGAVAFRSPKIALAYALKAMELEKGSSVMISALAPSWQYSAIVELGFVPLVLDVNEETGLVAPEIVVLGMKNGGRLLLIHESMGIVPDLERISALGIPVIEDISHSIGAKVVSEVASAESPAQEVSQSEEGAKAGEGSSLRQVGSFGVYSILGLEEHDTITAGGGAVLMAPGRREWTVLKKLSEEASGTDILPDINSALAWVQLKEFNRNEQARKTLFAVYQHSLMSGKNKTFVRNITSDEGSTIWSFPVVLAGSVKDAKQYAAKKDIEISLAYEDSVIARHLEELSSSCIVAKSLYLRCVLFPLYPLLGSEHAKKIAKVLGTLP
ncbi:DegT/DnrJ/EryC1/StrS family aminotransferase [Treponema zioleckii]|uniref:DegT/DnrJ/EryC1/StrS family aminotransferase n=1 Tax=Treponema zioleckii TaxID=331680 RepID=UPI00168B18E8|nr:DegT/DnrJ/EryC1/StrS family aminotransferase [Treponema zioleckii]